MSPSVWRRAARPAVVVVIAAAAGVSGSCSLEEGASAAGERTDYCAILSDSIGLYPGNPITQLGYQIGTVQTITPSPTDVRVDFTVTEHRVLAADVKAVVRSPSILADRSMELVGDYDSGPQLRPGECIPLSRSATPKSLSEVIGSATAFVDSINPDGSTNIGDVVQRLDVAFHGNGVGINQLLTTSSAVLDNPDAAVSDIGSILANVSRLSTTLTDIREPLKQIMLDAQQTTPILTPAVERAGGMMGGLDPAIEALADVEAHFGDEIQFLLDSMSVVVRKVSAHAPRLANLMNPVPWWIKSLANMVNNHSWQSIRYRPPLYRIRTPDGVALCNVMNASMPGSCANVQGTPYAVDAALLQYVLIEAAKR